MCIGVRISNIISDKSEDMPNNDLIFKKLGSVQNVGKNTSLYTEQDIVAESTSASLNNALNPSMTSINATNPYNDKNLFIEKLFASLISSDSNVEVSVGVFIVILF